MAFRGVKEPVSEFFFWGPVKSAELEIQEDGIVVAVSVESWCEISSASYHNFFDWIEISSPAVEVISLGLRDDKMFFVQMAHLPGVAYVKLLHGDFIGCLMKNGTSIPHLINWRTGDVHSLDDLPDVNVSLGHTGPTASVGTYKIYRVQPLS
jgi:hypothetical protein